MSRQSDLKAKRPTPTQPVDEADRWVLRMADGPLSAEAAREFNQWLLADPENEERFESAKEAYDRASYIRNDPRLEDWLKPSFSERMAGSLNSVAEAFRSGPRRRFALPVFGVLAAVASAALAIIVFAPGLLAPGAALDDRPGWVGAEPDFVTEIAEIRQETLPDGSIVTLGAASAIDVAFTAEERRVVLASGEAFFEVEENPNRPFIVVADGTLVRVLGTKFDVSLGVGSVDVAVSEGKVEIIQPDSVDAEIKDSDVKYVLTSGQKVVAANSGRVRPVETVDIANVAAWRQGDLVWENVAIKDILADLNRYTAGQVSVADAQVADTEYTFAFRADDVELAVDVIADTLGLVPVEIEAGVYELR